jgi:hypothetical protein
MTELSGIRFALHANQFTERGDSVTLMSIAKGLREELGIESVITIPKDAKGSNSSRILEARAQGFNLVEYKSRLNLEEIAKAEKLTHNYVISDGSLKGVRYSSDTPENFRLLDLRHLTQAVFRRYEPHGDAYAYISNWLYEWSQSRTSRLIHRPLGGLRTYSLSKSDRAPLVSWVPHIVEPTIGDGENFRRNNGIPSGARLIGRAGGYDQFNDPAAHRGLLRALENDKNAFAVMVNTCFFAQHDRLIYTKPLSRQEVWDFYAACDVLLNGRKMGESFGFSIAEPMSLGKPVVAPSLARNFRMDQHHIRLLKKHDLLYSNANQLRVIIDRELNDPTSPERLKESVSSFSQATVMKKFKDVFIHGAR